MVYRTGTLTLDIYSGNDHIGTVHMVVMEDDGRLDESFRNRGPESGPGLPVDGPTA